MARAHFTDRNGNHRVINTAHVTQLTQIYGQPDAECIIELVNAETITVAGPIELWTPLVGDDDTDIKFTPKNTR